jgi:hypothetical protein
MAGETLATVSAETPPRDWEIRVPTLDYALQNNIIV